MKVKYIFNIRAVWRLSLLTGICIYDTMTPLILRPFEFNSFSKIGFHAMA